jgi:hypothetical protein
MGRIWVLDTETKGTGAEMVPLERALEAKRSAPKGDRIEVIRRRPRSQPSETADPEPKESAATQSRQYKVVNAITGQTLAEDAGIHQTLTLLDGMRSIADARVSVRYADAADWQPLTLREQQALWAFRDR